MDKGREGKVGVVVGLLKRFSSHLAGSGGDDL